MRPARGPVKGCAVGMAGTPVFVKSMSVVFVLPSQFVRGRKIGPRREGVRRKAANPKAMRRTLIASLLGATITVGVPAHAAERCHVVATGLPGNASACEYTATGPGTFVVATASGFAVSIKRGILPWQTIAQGAGQTATAAAIASIAGDTVSIGIKTTVARAPNGAPVATIQDGTISAIE